MDQDIAAPPDHLLPPGTPQKQLPPPGKPSMRPGRPRSRSRRLWLLLALVLVVLLGVYLWRKMHDAPTSNTAAAAAGKANGKGGGRGGAGAPNVVAVRARRGNIGIYDTALGAVTPINTVTVKTRVDGELMSVNYREGALVKKGDLLMEIDPRPYLAVLTQAEGQLARDQATLENAKIDLTRYQTLIKTKSVPEQQLATQQATVKQDEGIVKADEGTVDSAKLNVIYTKLTAPITGRIGLRLVDPGNIVHASDQNGLLVITQIDPISVLFTLSEDQLPTVVKKMQAGQTLLTDAFDREMKNKLATGTLTTIDNQIDQSTGTVRLRSTFDNKNGALFPNQFVNARLLVETHRNAVLLATAAIQRNTNAAFLYLVQPDSTVTVRNITVGATEGDDSEITSGLNGGEVLVMSGADKLEEGTKVNAHIQGESTGNNQNQAASGQQNNTKQKGKKQGAKKQTGKQP